MRPIFINAKILQFPASPETECREGCCELDNVLLLFYLTPDNKSLLILSQTLIKKPMILTLILTYSPEPNRHCNDSPDPEGHENNL